jgi:Putative zinc-finger
MNCHECEEWLQRRLDGDPAAAVELEEHLAGCPSCRQQHQAAVLLLEGLQGLKRSLRHRNLTGSILTRVAMDRRAQRRLRVRMAGGALAACLLLAALAGYLWLPGSDTRRPVASGTELPAPAPQAVARAPSLTTSVAEARAAVASLTERLADKGKEQAQRWWPVGPLDVSQALPRVAELETPLDPAAKSLLQTGQGMSEGLQSVAQSARRAVAYFMRELPLEAPTKTGS